MLQQPKDGMTHVLPSAVPMVALVLCNHLLRHQGQCEVLGCPDAAKRSDAMLPAKDRTCIEGWTCLPVLFSTAEDAFFTRTSSFC